MNNGYSGLRRTRKRAHSSKCPCCYSSEDEEENHATTKKEKVPVKDSIQSHGKRANVIKKKLTSDDDDSFKEVANSQTEIVDVNRNGKKPQKVLPPGKRKKNGVKRIVSTSKHDIDKDTQDKCPISVKGKKPNIKAGPATSKNKKSRKNGDFLKNTALTEHHSKPKKAKNVKTEFKHGITHEDVNEIESQDSYSKSKSNICSGKTLSSSKSNATTKQKGKLGGSKIVNEKGKPSVYNRKLSAKAKILESDKQTESKGKSLRSKDISGGVSLKLSNEKEDVPCNKQKYSKSGSSVNDKRKIEVFDHLFCELKKCPGFRKVTVSSGADILLKLTAEKLKGILPSSRKSRLMATKLCYENVLLSSSKDETSGTLNGPSRIPAEFEKMQLVASDITSTSCAASPEMTVAGKGEEAKLSQAAEALVSFRSCIPLASEKDITNSNSEKTSGLPLHSGHKIPLAVTELVRQTLASTKEVTVSHDFDKFVNTSTHNNISVVSNPQSQPPVRLPTNIEANLKQGTTFQVDLMNANKLTPQKNLIPAVPGVVCPTTAAPRADNLSEPVMSAVMMNSVGVQSIQKLFCQPTQPSNIQTSLASQMPVLSLAATGSVPQLQPQQPLKGMEDVVSCVGSQTANSLLWNIKPATAPVVYLTSPQMLSGVRARNLIPPPEGHVPLPFSGEAPKVHSREIPKSSVSPGSSSMFTLGRVTLVNQSAPLNAVNVTCQRPILPREQRMPSLLSSLPQSASHLPVTTMVGPILQSTSPVHVGGVPIQLNSLGVSSSHSTGQALSSDVVTQATMTPATVTCVTPAPATQASFMQVAIPSTGQGPTFSSPFVTSVSAKQAVKKFVHERTKSAELKQTNNLNNLTSQESVISSSVDEMPETSTNPAPATQGGKSVPQTHKGRMSNPSMEFNLHQAASALLSISTQDALEPAVSSTQFAGEGEDSQDEHDGDVVFTSKGVFRVGDVDVDPQYNKIGREGYACGKCGKIFTSLSYLSRHIKRVCPDMSCRKWKCTMCDKAFRHPFGLQQHIYTHTGERPHKCSQCPKAFYSSNDLRRHSRIHSGERPYHCKHCDKSFATTISLKTHTYIHTGEKPHKCPHCPKTFATSSKLGRHIVTHAEQRPFTCNLCPKSFNRSGDLRRHNMHVHECHNKPFEFGDGDIQPSAGINLCGDNTQEQDNGKEHVLQCLVCGKQFDTSSALRHHLLSHDAIRPSGAKQATASQEQ